MKLNPTSVPDMFNEAKNFLDYKELSTPLNNHVYINIDKLKIYEHTLTERMKQVTFDFNMACFDIYGEFVEFDLSNRNNIKNALVKIHDIPYDELSEFGKFTVKTSVIQKLYDRYHFPALYHLLEYNRLKSKLSSVRQYTQYYFSFPISGVYNNEGDRAVRLVMGYKESDTRRFQSYEPNIQGLDARIADILTTPAGWVMLFTDSRQIEPRLVNSVMIRDPLINYLIEEYDDVYYALLDYSVRENIEPVDSNFKVTDNMPDDLKGMRNVLKTMVNAGSYGSQLSNITKLANKMLEDQYFATDEGVALIDELTRSKYYKTIIDNTSNPENIRREAQMKLDTSKAKLAEVRKRGEYLAQRFYDRYLMHPNRQEYLSKLKGQAYNGEVTLTTPFGDKRTVGGSFNHVFNCLINNPFQIMSARLSAISITKTFELINSHEKLKLFMFFGANFHDGDLVYIKKELIPHFGKQLNDFRSYEIEGWIPIPAEQNVYLDYKKSVYN